MYSMEKIVAVGFMAVMDFLMNTYLTVSTKKLLEIILTMKIC